MGEAAALDGQHCASHGCWSPLDRCLPATPSPVPSPPAQAGYLLSDPRETSAQWQAVLAPVAGPAGLKLQPAEESHVAQLLSVAFAKHELTGGSTAVALQWLESGGQASIDALLKAAQ